jgi:hypothetical protein
VKLRASRLAKAAALVVALWLWLAGARHVYWAQCMGLGACAALAVGLHLSRSRCRRAAAHLLLEAGERAGLRGVDVGAAASPPADHVNQPADLDEEEVCLAASAASAAGSTVRSHSPEIPSCP